MYQGSWQVPQACSVCGEPVTDGKPYLATVTLDKQYKGSGPSVEVTTHMASVPFPRCAKCVKATSRHGYAQAIAGVIGIVFGIAGITGGAQFGGSWLWACGAGLLVWIGASIAGMKLAEWLLERSFDDDMRRRAQLSEHPVTITRRGGRDTSSRIRFAFSNDDYGRLFEVMNP